MNTTITIIEFTVTQDQAIDFMIADAAVRGMTLGGIRQRCIQEDPLLFRVTSSPANGGVSAYYRGVDDAGAPAWTRLRTGGGVDACAPSLGNNGCAQPIVRFHAGMVIALAFQRMADSRGIARHTNLVNGATLVQLDALPLASGKDPR